MFYQVYHDTPIGTVTLGELDGKLTHLLFGDNRPKGYTQREGQVIQEAKRQLDEYFAGQRKTFSIPLDARGTDYRQSIWRLLLDIPYGETITYGELARRSGNPKASRAVGGANHHNPISVIIPCHRVVGADGSMTGYGGGVPIKEFLLKLERDNAV